MCLIRTLQWVQTLFLNIINILVFDVVAILGYDALLYCRNDTTLRHILSIPCSGDVWDRKDIPRRRIIPTALQRVATQKSYYISFIVNENLRSQLGLSNIYLLISTNLMH